MFGMRRLLLGSRPGSGPVDLIRGRFRLARIRRGLGSLIFFIIKVEGDRWFFLFLLRALGFALRFVRLPLRMLFLSALILLANSFECREVNRIVGAVRASGPAST